MAVFEIRVSLLGAESAVWRRVRVPADFHLRTFHVVLQAVMGWENCHLHEFVSADQKRYGDIDGDIPQPGVLDESQCLLSDIFSEPGDRCLYLYDFGDNWGHEVVLEAVSEVGPEEQPVLCLGGQGACPPEDCGGVPGYLQLLEQFDDSDAVGHAEAVELLGEDFDPEAFDCDVFNRLVAGMFKRFGESQGSEMADEDMQLILKLQEFLESDGVPESAMSVVMLDGYFTALAIYPVPVMPSVWLSNVWDLSGNGRQPEFESQQEAARVLGMLFSLMNAVTAQFSEEEPECVPLYQFAPVESDEEQMLAAMDWAKGFLMGAMFDEEVWMRTISGDEGRDLLGPFVIMSGLSDEESDIGEERRKEIREGLIDELGLCVLDLADLWEPWKQEYLARPGAGRTVKAAPRVGRNEPCPCGSGKKYKQCCGK